MVTGTDGEFSLELSVPAGALQPAVIARLTARKNTAMSNDLFIGFPEFFFVDTCHDSCVWRDKSVWFGQVCSGTDCEGVLVFPEMILSPRVLVKVLNIECKMKIRKILRI